MGVNLNCIDVYDVLERANDRKLHVFATKHEVNIFNMYAFAVGLKYASLSNIMLGISNSLFDILL